MGRSEFLAGNQFRNDVNLPGHGERRRLARHRRVEQRHGRGAELAGLKYC